MRHTPLRRQLYNARPGRYRCPRLNQRYSDIILFSLDCQSNKTLRPHIRNRQQLTEYGFLSIFNGP